MWEEDERYQEVAAKDERQWRFDSYHNSLLANILDVQFLPILKTTNTIIVSAMVISMFVLATALPFINTIVEAQICWAHCPNEIKYNKPKIQSQ